MTKFFVTILLSLLVSHSALAISQDLFRQRQSGGTTTQWTLLDWLKQKNSMKLMDQWLVLNTSNSLFDISASATGQRYRLKSDNGTVSTSQYKNSEVYNLDMYISILGIHGEYEKSDEKREGYGGSVGLRLLGSSSRSTFLRASYGLHVLNDLLTQEKWENKYAEAQLQLYLIEDFGLNARYRHYFPADSNKGNRLEGSRATAGLFYDFLIFRLYGNYFQEPTKVTTNNVEDKQDRTGYDFGLRLFF